MQIRLVGSAPNVYAFTKALGEEVLRQKCRNLQLPCAIVRPSTVTAAIQEPFPGWIDNMNGPTGMIYS